MAALRQPFGFKPARNITGGGFNPSTVRYAVGVAPARPIFIGDAVTVSGNTVTPVAASAACVQVCLGVVMQLLDTNAKPLVFSQPTRGPVLPSATAGYADVYIDNSNTYYVATDATAGAANLNQFLNWPADASAGAANLAVGRSAFVVSMTSALTFALGKSATHPWRVIGPAFTRDLTPLTLTDSWIDGVEVVLAYNAVDRS